MQWEYLTATEFKAAVKQTGVCVIAMGVIEKHGEHLPLGTDVLNGHRLACLAAEIEPAVVFPPFYFGQIYEARCFPGTVTLKPSVLLDVVQGTLDEIGRNGFKKIVIVNAHGGNWFLLKFLAQASLWEEKPYNIYIPGRGAAKTDEAWKKLLKTQEHAHACECETSVSMANHPHLVKMERVPKTPATALKRLEAMPDHFSGIGWYADYPEHYAGDARPANAKTGRALRTLRVKDLADFIRAVKKDKVSPALQKEFFRRVEQVGE
jgi:creatinine amidohydrolase